MSQTVQYEKPFLKKGVSTIETGDLAGTDATGTTGAQTRADYLKQKRFSSTFSQYYLNNKKAKELLSVASIDSQPKEEKDPRSR